MQVRQEDVTTESGARLHPCTLAVGFIPLIHLELNVEQLAGNAFEMVSY